jgi:hypothetical protein
VKQIPARTQCGADRLAIDPRAAVQRIIDQPFQRHLDGHEEMERSLSRHLRLRQAMVISQDLRGEEDRSLRDASTLQKLMAGKVRVSGQKLDDALVAPTSTVRDGRRQGDVQTTGSDGALLSDIVNEAVDRHRRLSC